MAPDRLNELLNEFEPFDRLTDEERDLLATRSELRRAAPGEVLFEAGERDPWLICLHEGALELLAADGRGHRIDAGTPAARQPVSQLKPRRYRAVAATPVQYLRIDDTGLGDLFELPGTKHYEVREIDEPSSPAALSGAAASVGEALDEQRMTLPSLPAVALQATRTIDREDVDIPTVARVVMTDPAITAKLIRAANSAVFYGRGEVTSCERAILRLGVRTTRQLVVAFALREVFNVKSKALQSRVEALWEQSTHVAAVALVLSRKLRLLDPDEAQLAGLLHRIGVVPVLHHAAQHPALAADPARLDLLCDELCPVLGERMLRAWNFPEPLVTAVRDAGQWWRDPAPAAQMADLILVATLVTRVNTPGFAELPPLVRLPAFKKTIGDQLSPEGLMQVIAEAEQQIAELRALFRT